MKFSVVTATFNSAKTLERCLLSVKAQDGVQLEHIIVDGGSSDGTLEILKNSGLKFISEPDDGVYDAFNKGLALSSGDVISFLGSDDIYLPGALAKVEAAFNANPQALCLHGNIVVNGRELRPSKGLLSIDGVRIYHPATFMKRKLFDAVGGFDSSFKIAADLDLFLRARKLGPFLWLDAPLTEFALGGLSTKQLMKTALEARAILLRNGKTRLFSEFFFFQMLARSALSLVKRAVRP